MSNAGRALRTAVAGRRVARGYGATAVLLFAALALKSSDVEEWFWRSVATFLPLIVSCRSAMVYVHRKQPSKLTWWLRPTPGAEREFDTTWLIYAVLFGAGSLAFVLI